MLPSWRSTCQRQLEQIFEFSSCAPNQPVATAGASPGNGTKCDYTMRSAVFLERTSAEHTPRSAYGATTWATASVYRRRDVETVSRGSLRLSAGFPNPLRGCRANTGAARNPISRRWPTGTITATGLKHPRDHRLALGRMICGTFPMPPAVAKCHRDKVGRGVYEERESVH